MDVGTFIGHIFSARRLADNYTSPESDDVVGIIDIHYLLSIIYYPLLLSLLFLLLFSII
jgi:hypothetical protein